MDAGGNHLGDEQGGVAGFAATVTTEAVANVRASLPHQVSEQDQEHVTAGDYGRGVVGGARRDRPALGAPIARKGMSSGSVELSADGRRVLRGTRNEERGTRNEERGTRNEERYSRAG